MLMRRIVYMTPLVAILVFCIAVYAGSTDVKKRSNLEPSANERKEYNVQSILFNEADRKLYVFGHMQTNPEGDQMPTTEEPKILIFSEDGKLETKAYAAFFGLESYATHEHNHDSQSVQTYFIDPVHRQFLSFEGNPQSASAAFSRLLYRSPNPEAFFNLGKMPPYGFLVSITKSPKRMWVAPRTGGGGPYAWARDEKNGLLWEGDEGVLKIYVDGTSQATMVRQNDFYSAIFPDERDGTAWVYLSHQKGELRHIDRTGKILNSLPFVKFTGSKTPIVVDFRRDVIWYVDNVYPFRLVKMSFSGARQLELTGEQILGSGFKRGCWKASLTLQEADGIIWLYCSGLGLYKIDSSGKLLLTVASGF